MLSADVVLVDLQEQLGLTGSPDAYSRFKDIVTGPIPTPNPEPALQHIDIETVFEHLVDDGMGRAETVEKLIWLLHHHDFPWLAWSKLTLNPTKTRVFVDRVDVLGFTKEPGGLRSSADKVAAIRDWPTPQTEQQPLSFPYMLPFLHTLIRLI